MSAWSGLPADVFEKGSVGLLFDDLAGYDDDDDITGLLEALLEQMRTDPDWRPLGDLTRADAFWHVERMRDGGWTAGRLRAAIREAQTEYAEGDA